MKSIQMPKGVKKAIRNKLRSLPKEVASDKLRQINNLYNRFVSEQPDIGGKKNVLYEQLYTSLAIFAYYETFDKKTDLQEIEELAVAALIGHNETLGKFIDFNSRWVQKIYAKLYIGIKKQTDSHIADGSWHNTWKFEINPESRTEGVNIRLIGCPVYDFAKTHGYEDIMTALCKSDYKVFEPFHCKIIRYHTVANGDGYCEFWQVGDKSFEWLNADKDKLL